MRRIIVSALLATTLLAGCGVSGVGPQLAGTEPDLLTADSLTSRDQDELAATVEELAAQFYADEGADPAYTSNQPTLNGPRGGLIYRSMVKSKTLRAIGNKISYLPVKRHFNKRGTQDQVPPISAQERQKLMATLRPGDVIQCGNNASFVHAAFYMGNDRIVHALAQPGFGREMVGVLEEGLSEYFDRVDRDKVVVLRPQWTPEKLGAALSIAREQVGKPYDTLFLTDVDDRLYCTELVYHVLTRTGVARVEPHLVKAKWRLITNEDLRKSPDLDVVYRFNHD